MSRLRAVGGRGRGCGSASLSTESKTALDVAADATLDGADLADMQVQALMNAASFTDTSEDLLRSGIAERGNCTDERADPEDWFLAHNEEEVSHVDSPHRREIREQATILCWGCPVRGQCLALSFALGEHGVQGVWGGLGARDRVELLPLWRELSARLTPVTAAAQVDDDRSARVSSVVEFGDEAGAA